MLRKLSEIIINGMSLEEILSKHEIPLILANADLSYTNLRGANLRDADLSKAILNETDLSYTALGR